MQDTNSSSKKKRRSGLARFLKSAVPIATLGVVFWQGKSILDQIDVTKTQLTLSQSTSEFSILQQLRAGTVAITETIYRSGGVFELARENHCSPMPEDADDARTLATVAYVVGHYELYYQAAKRHLVSPAEWTSTCLGALELFSQNCLLRDKWENKLSKKADPAFLRSFVPKCELVE
jgi:hypothetical protein